MLGLTFVNEADYDLILEDDTYNFIYLIEIKLGKQLTLEVIHDNGNIDRIKLNHTYNQGQIAWYKEGSSLNLIKKKNS